MFSSRYATGNRKILTLVCHGWFSMYWPSEWSIRIDTRTLPHPQNESQWSVNNSWSCILGNLGGDRLQIVINEVLAAIIRKRESEMLPAPSGKWMSTECERLLAFHLCQSQCDVAGIVCIHGFDCSGTRKGSRILSRSSLNEMSRYCPGGCGGNIPYVSAYKGWHLLVYGCLWLSATHITEDARPKIIHATLMLILEMGQGAFHLLLCL